MRTVTYEQAVIEAAQNLVKVKGRRHSEQAYQRLVDAVKTLAAAPDHPATAGDAEDAKRWRAVCARHGASLVRRFVDTSGNFSSVTKKAQLDAWADAAAKDIAEWDALTPEQKIAHLQSQADAAIRASKGSE